MIHVSIILINFNSKKETLECLSSLKSINSSGFNFNIIVVDNASKDIFNLTSDLMNKHTEVIRSETNKGFTGGNNMGIYYAVEKYNSDYVLLLNNDTTVDSNFLKKLIKVAESDPKVGMVSSKIYFSKGREYHKKSYNRSQLGNILWYAGGSLDWNHLVAFHRGVDEIDRGQFDTQTESDFATGCSVLVKREILEKIGTLDKRYFLYLEDVDWSVRVVKSGYKIAFCSESIVFHKNAGSTDGSGSKLQQYYQTRNRLLFTFKYGTWREILIAFRIAFKIVIFGTPSQRQGVFHFLTMQFGKQPII